MGICLGRSADLHMAQLMPLPPTDFCFSKIQIGSTFLVLAHPGSPRQRAIKWVLLLLINVCIASELIKVRQLRDSRCCSSSVTWQQAPPTSLPRRRRPLLLHTDTQHWRFDFTHRHLLCHQVSIFSSFSLICHYSSVQKIKLAIAILPHMHMYIVWSVSYDACISIMVWHNDIDKLCINRNLDHISYLIVCHIVVIYDSSHNKKHMSYVFIRAGSQNSPSRANAILWCALTSHNVESSYF